jgi:hypothetical protein
MVEVDQPNRLAGIMRATARELRAQFEKSMASNHSGSKGDMREEFVAGFLRNHLPRRVGVLGSAEIVTADGQVSPQCDILIVDPDVPPLFSAEHHRVVPNEAVYGVMEVKSTLDGAELRDACNKIARVRNLPKVAYEPELLHSSLWHSSTPSYLSLGLPPVPFTAAYIFAYDSIDLRNLASQLGEWCETHPLDCWPDSVWVLGKGALFWTPPDKTEWRLRAEPGADIGVATAVPDQDILLMMLMHLYPRFARASMPTFQLLDYSGPAALGELIGRVSLTPTNE